MHGEKKGKAKHQHQDERCFGIHLVLYSCSGKMRGLGAPSVIVVLPVVLWPVQKHLEQLSELAPASYKQVHHALRQYDS